MEIRPLRGLRYDTDVVGSLENVLSPPYDQYDEEMQAAAYARSPHHFVRLILNREANPYAAAAKTLDDWTVGGVLRREPAPAIYPYTQTYRDPNGEERSRHGFLALLRLTALADGPVYAHERTLPKPLGDRYELLRTTKADFGPVFVVFPDKGGEVTGALADAEAASPEIDVLDGDGNRHRLWVQIDVVWQRRLLEALVARDGVIADGHHRYKSALQYAEERRMAGAGADDPANFKLVAFLPATADNLTVYPIHRVVEKWPEALSPETFFTVSALDDPETLPQRVTEVGRTVGTLSADGNAALWTLRSDAEWPEPENLSPAYRSLPTALLEAYVLRGLLGMSADAIAHKEGLAFAKGMEAAKARLQRGYARAFILPPTPLEAIFATARAGELMPQKSTYFYPKLLSGLVTYRHQA